MPIDPTKPPDPIIDEFCTLTGMSSDGSASVGARVVLKRLRNSKMAGKGRSRGKASPMVGNGKRFNPTLVDEALSKGDGYCLINGNDGSFINNTFDTSMSDVDNNKSSMVDKEIGVDGFVDPCLVSNGASKFSVADVNHIEVENTRKANKDDGKSGFGDSGFVFGDIQGNKGILKKPSNGLTSVQFGPSLFYKSCNVWNNKSGIKALNSDGYLNIESFVEKIKKGVKDKELQMNFTPNCVSKNSDGSKRIAISIEDIKKGSEACALQLYGYFVGTSMDYKVVNANLSRMWRVHGISDITKTSVGLFYFKFKSEEGMKAVLESGLWIVNNIPLVLNVWEPGIWLEKVEPSTIPIWVCVYGIPMELCNGNGIGKIYSGIGKPMLIDKLTKERFLKKSGKLDFARVLVEVSAVDDLSHSLEIEYPQIGNRPARIGKLDVKYQWQPPQCSHCKTFGHSTVSCKVMPRTEDEIAAKTKRDAVRGCDNDSKQENMDLGEDDGFIYVGRRNKVRGFNSYQQSYLQKGNAYNKQFQNRNFQLVNRPFSGNFRQNGRMGPNKQSNNNYSKQHSNVKGMNVGEGSGGLKQSSKVGNFIAKSFQRKSVEVDGEKGRLVHKPPLSSRYNEAFKPKVLVRGSGSTSGSTMVEDLPLKNAFQALDDHDMIDKNEDAIENIDEEYANVVWPKLKLKVEETMKSGVYPSLAVKTNWSLSQLDFFYKNCSSFGMEPYVEDDDVESENEGMAEIMKPENFDVNGPVPVQDQVINLIRDGGYSLCGLLETRVKEKKLNRVCSRVLGNWDWMSNSAVCEGGTGIVVGLDPNVVRVMIHSQSSQVMNLFVEAVNGHQKFFCSFIYAHVKSSGRKALWRDLVVHSLAVKDAPWTL
ncbi:RNA-directed DNA polymerase, eukaryota, reverse transcriptase zinc-binding domain protein [Tanacetum coccineum]